MPIPERHSVSRRASLLVAVCVSTASWTASPANGQQPPDLKLLYSQGEYAKVIEQGTAWLQDHDDAEVHHFVGRAMVDADYNLRADVAIEHLRRCMRGLPREHWMLGWSHVYVGMAHDMVGRTKQARDAYELALAVGGTTHCLDMARQRIAAHGAATAAPIIEEMSTLYGRKQYEAVIRLGRRTLADVAEAGTRGPAIPDPYFYHLLGRSLVEVEELRGLEGAIDHLQISLELGDQRAWIAGWNHFYLGRAQELRQELDLAKASYERTIQLAATEESVKSARFRLRHLGRDPYDKWKSYEMDLVTLRFPPDSPIAKHPAEAGRRFDLAAAKIARSLTVTPKGKITVYLYNDNAQGRELTGADLAWADRDNQAVHQHPGNTVGHEMVHCMSHFIAPQPYCNSVLLNEGLAVYFDQTRRDKHALAHTMSAGNRLPTFSDLETAFRARDDSYPLAGSFVGFLWSAYSPELFQSVWRDSANGNYEKAFKKHYGKSSDQLSREWTAFLRDR